MTQSTPPSPVDRLAVGYQLKIHLLGISPQISRRVLVRGDTILPSWPSYSNEGVKLL